MAKRIRMGSRAADTSTGRMGQFLPRNEEPQ